MGIKGKEKNGYIIETRVIDGKLYLVAKRVRGKEPTGFSTAKPKLSRTSIIDHSKFDKIDTYPVRRKSISTFLEDLAKQPDQLVHSQKTSEPIQDVATNQVSLVIGTDSYPNDLIANDLANIVTSFTRLAEAAFESQHVDGNLIVRVSSLQKGCFIINFILDVALYLDVPNANALELAANISTIVTNTIEAIAIAIGVFSAAKHEQSQPSDDATMRIAHDFVLNCLKSAGDTEVIEFRWRRSSDGEEEKLTVRKSHFYSEEFSINDGGRVGSE